MALFNDIHSIEEKMINIRRQLHQYPELSLQEDKTAVYIKNRLEQMGFDAHSLADTGVVATLYGEKPGKTIALRADMDALQIAEKNQVIYQSKHEGVMHACGHDGHMAMVFGAAMLLKQMQKNLSGNVKFIFQPAEEEYGGARRMIQAGALENPQVDAILALHLWADIRKGYIGTKEGCIMASNDRFKITIQGKSGHGAMPQTGIDALATACQVYNSLQLFITKEVDPLDNLVLNIGKFSAGSAYNIIPSEAIMEGTVRCTNEETRANVEKRLYQIVEGVAMAHRAKFKLEYKREYPPTINHGKEILKAVEVSAKDVFGADGYIALTKPVMPAEDFAYYLKEVPGAMCFVGTKDDEYCYPLHHEKFNFDESVLTKGALFLANTVVDYLQSDTKIETT